MWIPYSLPESYKSSDWVRETLLGSSYFENYRLSIKKFKSVSEISLLIQTRKLTQSQFEEITRNKQEIVKNTSLGEIAVAAGYKILQKYKKLFYPYLIYSDPEIALEVFDRSSYTVTEFNYFYKKNYKIADSYDFPNENIKNIKEIFVTEDKYKYI